MAEMAANIAIRIKGHIIPEKSAPVGRTSEVTGRDDDDSKDSQESTILLRPRQHSKVLEKTAPMKQHKRCDCG